jgi:hypothetical protein
VDWYVGRVKSVAKLEKKIDSSEEIGIGSSRFA